MLQADQKYSRSAVRKGWQSWRKPYSLSVCGRAGKQNSTILPVAEAVGTRYIQRWLGLHCGTLIWLLCRSLELDFGSWEKGEAVLRRLLGNLCVAA